MKNYTPIVSMLVICIICCSNMNYGASELTESEKFPHSEELPRAARYCNIEKVKKLLKEGYSIDSVWSSSQFSSDCGGWTPLMEAADYGHQDLLGLLIRYRDEDGQGPEIDQRDRRGRTAFMYTVITYGRPGEKTRGLAYLLLKVGADYTIQSKDNLSFVGIIEKLSISEKKKEDMIKKSQKIVQDRWDVIYSEWNDIHSTADYSLMPIELISLFFSFLYDEKNEKLGIDKKAYLKNDDRGDEAEFKDNVNIDENLSVQEDSCTKRLGWRGLFTRFICGTTD